VVRGQEGVLTGPSSSVKLIDDLKLTATVTNTGAEPIKLLKYGTVLDELLTRSFKVMKDGQDVKFTGVKIRNDCYNLHASILTRTFI
jgi:deuterolysin